MGEVIHQFPPGDSGVMPCCGRVPLEVFAQERMTADESLVTCSGGQAPLMDEDKLKAIEDRTHLGIPPTPVQARRLIADLTRLNRLWGLIWADVGLLFLATWLVVVNR